MRVSTIGILRGALGYMQSWHYRIFHRHRYDSYVLERIGAQVILVTPQVFNPKLMRTGEFFAQQLTAAQIPENATVLDMGAGSGVCALATARHARRVVAVDINEAAVRCVRINAQLNRLEHKIEARCGDLFAPVAGERFDLILFNPPFLHGVPTTPLDHAWRSVDAVERFAAELHRHLTPSGFALVLLSSYGDAMQFAQLFHPTRYDLQPIASRRYLNEELTLLRIQPAARVATLTTDWIEDAAAPIQRGVTTSASTA